MNFRPQFRSYSTRGRKFRKKNCKKIQKIKKQLSGVSFSQNGIRQDEIGQERDKEMLNPNSAHTRPGGANYKKKQQKNSKNQRTTIRHYFYPNWDYTRGRKFRKKIAKKFKKIKKQLSVVIFSKNGTRQDEIGQERDKIIFDPNSAHTRPRGENCKEKTAKKFKN